MVAGSGLKGSLREKAECAWKGEPDKVSAVFGPDRPTPGAESAGAMVVSDARIVAFPVRSLQQVYVWIVCPLLLARLARDLTLIEESSGAAPMCPSSSLPRGTYAAPTGTALKGILVVEDERLVPIEDEEERKEFVDSLDDLTKWINKHFPGAANMNVVGRLVLVPDEVFGRLIQYATQVSARVQLNEQKTTGRSGNFWYEESLPPESLMYAFLRAEKPRYPKSPLKDADALAQAMDEMLSAQKFVQVGGNETVGQGWCRAALYKANANWRQG